MNLWRLGIVLHGIRRARRARDFHCISRAWQIDGDLRGETEDFKRLRGDILDLIH
jgi:hypothetical protein